MHYFVMMSFNRGTQVVVVDLGYFYNKVSYSIN